ncbi:MAG: family 10 glycosylhydrolase [Acidobacteriota bacterium]
MRKRLYLRIAIAIFVTFEALAVVSYAQTRPQSPRNTIWVSSTASADVIADRESISRFADRAKRSGFDTVILYSKELNGHVIYPSKIAPRLAEHKGVQYDTSFDPLKVFIEECHKRGMRLHAAFDIFTEGNKQIPGVGVGFGKHKEWQSVAYDVDEGDRRIKIAPIGEFKQGLPLWVNAGMPEVQNYEISIIEEVVKKYDVDGVVMDRARWNGANTDFSDHSRGLFAKYAGDRKLKFPETSTK